MLLRDSEIAKQIRTYLLDIEEMSNQMQRANATRGSSWDGLDVVLLDIINTEVLLNNGTLTSACMIASKKLGKTIGACKTRYSSHIKKLINNDKLIKKIEQNRKHLKVVDSSNRRHGQSEVRESFLDELYVNEIIKNIHDIKQYIDKITNEQINSLIAENQKLKSENVLLRKKYNKLNADHKQFKAVIASSIQIKVIDELTNTFKMDRNGNLERIS